MCETAGKHMTLLSFVMNFGFERRIVSLKADDTCFCIILTQLRDIGTLGQLLRWYPSLNPQWQVSLSRTDAYLSLASS
jgi:hypothetical protein